MQTPKSTISHAFNQTLSSQTPMMIYRQRNILSPDMYIPRTTKNPIKYRILAEKRTPSVMHTPKYCISNQIMSAKYTDQNIDQEQNDQNQIKNRHFFGKYDAISQDRT